VFACYRIGARTLKNSLLGAISLCSFLAISFVHLPFPAIVLAAGLIGHFGGRISPEHFKAGGGHDSGKQDFGAALIDDATLPPSHALFSWSKVVRIGLIGIAIWLAIMAALLVRYGWDSTFTQMGWFFTKAALLTFGGAYAVLPYVYQGAVESYHWLTPVQMIDGLALGETTPGPLIMVVTFVGFVGGWNRQVFGADAVFASACLASAIVTFFTFLPSFIFIFLGGPFIETTHGNLKLTAPLTVITAAVVGVIASLAVFFGEHIFLPNGWNHPVDGFSLLLASIAMLALFRFKGGVIPVILCCGIAGWIRSLL